MCCCEGKLRNGMVTSWGYGIERSFYSFVFMLFLGWEIMIHICMDD